MNLLRARENLKLKSVKKFVKKYNLNKGRNCRKFPTKIKLCWWWCWGKKISVQYINI